MTEEKDDSMKSEEVEESIEIDAKHSHTIE